MRARSVMVLPRIKDICGAGRFGDKSLRSSVHGSTPSPVAIRRMLSIETLRSAHCRWQFCGWIHWWFSLRFPFLIASASSDHMQHIRQHNDLSMKEAGAFEGSVAARRLVCYSFVP